jgi:apurinic endonuclease APN1
MYSVQFFMGSPYSYNRAIISASDIAKCKKILQRFSMTIFTHFPYIANLAGSKKSLAWKDDNAQNNRTLYLLKNLQYELNTLSKLNTKTGVVIHPGNYPNREKGLLAIVKSINKLEFAPESKLILENSAGQGTSLVTSLAEIKTIIEGVYIEKRSHIGVCIDTCHLYAVGEYDLSLSKEIDRFFQDFSSLIGLEYFTLLHLNDSKTPKGARVDRHACLGTGYIWKKSIVSLQHLLNKCQISSIPIVVETNYADLAFLATIPMEYQNQAEMPQLHAKLLGDRMPQR